MENIGAFFAMGGYAGFVWPAFAVTLGLMAVLCGTTWRRLKSAERALEAMERAAPAEDPDT
jgi:heme exporter protein D